MASAEFVIFAAVASAAVALFMYWSMKEKKPSNIWLVVLTIVASGILTALIYSQYLVLSWFFFVAVAVATLSSMLPVLYRNKTTVFMIVVFIIAFAAAISFDRLAIVAMFGIGATIGMLYSQYITPVRREDKSMRRTHVELKRDIFQAILGLAIIIIMLVWQTEYIYIIFGLILIAFLFNNMISKTGSIYRDLSGMERRDVLFGLGAMQIAAGTAMLLGLASYKLALFGIYPLFFGDALATMTGIRFYRSNKLPYNRRKSVAGALAFFVATVIPGVILLGLWGVPIAFVLTLVESVDLPVDDNIAIPIATIILGALAGLG